MAGCLDTFCDNESIVEWIEAVSALYVKFLQRGVEGHDIHLESEKNEQWGVVAGYLL